MVLSVFFRRWRILVLFLTSFPSLLNAVQLVSNSSIPANLTGGCIAALHSDVNCSPVVAALRSGSYYTEATLKSTCTTDCRTALSAYESRIVSACGDQTWNGYEDIVMPVAIIPDMLFYLFNLTCLMDSNRYCNNIAATAALALDPGSGDAVTGGSIGNANSTGAPNATDLCDLCFVKNLQFQAGSPYYGGPLLAEQSVYQSKTSSCGITGYPLTTSDLSFYTPTASATVTPTACAGKSYSIQPTDDCHSISISQGIGTGWLLYDNDLQAFCADFPKTGNLCLINTCRVYTVQNGDTCTSIAAAQNITASQLKAWNALIDPGCYNIDKMNGSQLCVSAPGTAYVTPSVTVAAPTVATTAAPAPSDVALGTNPNCGRYYQVKPGDYCNLIIIKFGITLSDFVFLNPTLNQNCTNLFAAESYCVQAVGDINTYSGRAGYSTSTPINGSVTAKFSDLPDATYTSPITSSTSVPFADGTRADCNKYFFGDTFQNGVAGTNWNSECQLAAAVYDVDLASFGVWNTGLGNVTLSTCSFQKGVQYCGKLYFGSAPDPPPPSSALPIRDGASPNCTEFVNVKARWTCQDVLGTFDLTIAQFFAYNPAVKSDCSGLWTGYRYCIRTPDYVSPKASTTTGSGITTDSGITTGSGTTTSDAGSGVLKPTSPVQTGQPTNCNKWHTAQSGDSCASIENTYLITNEQFHTWNPATSTDCSTGFWAGYAYCVGTTDVTTTRSSSSTPTPISSSLAAPTPNQAGNAISSCNKYAATQGGDYCSLFAAHNSISTANLYAWNNVLGTDGAGCASQFWAGYYYCVGVSS